MINILERQKDILSIISKLDISPTMYKNAIEKYKAITAFLADCGIEADIYPQGSFAFGTVVRPSSKDPSASYDLDVICQVKGDKLEYAPSSLRNQIEAALTSSNVYGGKLHIWAECFTVEYADINDVAFTIDIVPAVDESHENKERLVKMSHFPALIDTAIAIPKHNGERNYTWITNNPIGFRTWFNDINEPFLAYSRKTYRESLFEENRTIFASVEEIPYELERSALQREIQILKYHRDVFYANVEDGDDIKPISAIITAVVAKIVEKHTPNCSVFELLEFTLNELNIYSEQQRLTIQDFTRIYGERTIFSRPDGKWYISNPANPEDNLANKWNEDSRIPKRFFQWIKIARTDLITDLQQKEDKEFRATLENGFGCITVASILGQKYKPATAPKPIIPQTAAKPYHADDIR